MSGLLVLLMLIRIVCMVFMFYYLYQIIVKEQRQLFPYLALVLIGSGGLGLIEEMIRGSLGGYSTLLCFIILGTGLFILFYPPNKCSKCGHELNEVGKFCGRCGTGAAE